MNSWCIAFACFFSFAAHVSAQSIRLPINYFELLPPETLWLLEGEGLLRFDYRGEYRFDVQLQNGQLFRSTTVCCEKDAIVITEIHRSDTTTIEIFHTPEGGMVFTQRKGNVEIDQLAVNGLFPSIELVSRSKKVFALEGDAWNFYPDQLKAQIFGSAYKLDRSVYAEDVYDQWLTKREFRREVGENGKPSFTVSEKKWLGTRIKSSSGYTAVLRKRSIRFLTSNIYLKMRRPPIEATVYTSKLIITAHGEGHFRMFENAPF